jgi:hypothetical protein
LVANWIGAEANVVPQRLMPPKEKTALRRRRPKWAGGAVAVEIISPEMLPNVSSGPLHLMDAPGDGLSVLRSGLQRDPDYVQDHKGLNASRGKPTIGRS